MAKYEMEQAYYTEMDKLKQENEMEMLVIRDELDKTNESMKQKERDFEMKFDQFQTAPSETANEEVPFSADVHRGQT